MKLSLCNVKSLKDGEYLWGVPTASYAAKYTSSVSFARTLFSREAQGEPSNYSACLGGVRRQLESGSWFRLTKDRDTFLLRAKLSVVVSVHFACEGAHFACAVLTGTFCDMCGVMGSGHALDQVRGRVGIPAKVRELIFNFNRAHGSAGKAVASNSKILELSHKDWIWLQHPRVTIQAVSTMAQNNWMISC